MSSHPDFPTPEMQAVARELDARIDHGLSKARHLQQTMDELAKEEADAEAAAAAIEGEPAPLPDANDLRTMVTQHALTPEWRSVIERIDRGGLTWDEVVTSLRSGTADQEVTAAFQSMATVAPPTEEEMVAMGLQPAPTDGPEDSDTERPGRR